MEVWLSFLAGLAGSVHCIGMCGGIVAAMAMGGKGGAEKGGHLFMLSYNLGRLTTYTVLGAAAGLLGSSLDLLAVREASFVIYGLANFFVIVVGVASVLGIQRFSIFAIEGSGGGFLATPLRRVIASDTPWRGFGAGIILGFLPCGLVYAPLVTAAATGSPFRGGAVMAALGLGTIPLLFAFGSASAVLSVRVRSGFLRLAGLLVALMGAAGIARILAVLPIIKISL